MIRLLVVTVAALYSILWVFGDESRRPEVARAEPLGLALVPAAYEPEPDIATIAFPVSDISDQDAVRMALEAGAKARSDRKSEPLRGGVRVAAVETVETVEQPVAASSASQNLWYVTGSRVNLRSGPGTSNGIVGSLTQGAGAEVLGDENGWYQIRTADGAISGWIFGKFLQPG